MQQQEFSRRRQELMSLMGEGSAAVLAAAPERIRNRDVHYRFRQDSDFHYLTGFSEPEAVLVLVPGRPQGEFILFCRERDPDREIWDGPRAGQDGAVRDHGADDAFPIDDIDEILPGLLEGKEKLYCVLGVDPEFDHALFGWVNQIRGRARAGARAPGEFVAVEHHLHEMRLIKSAAEIELMQEAATVAAAAHRRAMEVTRPGMHEFEVEAEFQAIFRRHNGEHAYLPIVGGGRNGCVLHYINNNAVLNDGELLLIDAGCELDCYASDITRTFPVNGRFSGEQRAVYEVVLEAQLQAIAAVAPGAHWNRAHEVAVRVLTQGLKDLGLLEGELDGLIESEAYRPFYMHRTGHWLGMDVHDVGDYKLGGEWRELEPGMVLTIEPGLYISDSIPEVDSRWHNIGIRIEDDVAVTRDGHLVLSAAAPKTMDDIENLMRH
ncbi:Xaa-Pro aminopeptidase [Natronocella acetinitrilica]|uniref:Xaa-Pro aminopeptidase n=1 Tax=Natronocella acetinitrilica TaxID=414046 RepID=A0AAE3G055_9GAMM|nr:aminopeptidase P N-terminal domain-containing protein [Natronocella acetinitrilica]MCP1672991.1 Xaa-Pro aminopeptidase [Natronocella acetinitrilica]